MATEPSNGLALIADVKTFLGIPSSETTQDDNVAAYLEAACDHIEKQLGRTLRYQGSAYTEYVDVQGPTTVIHVKHVPIIAITSIDDAWDVQSSSGTALTADQDYFVGSSDRGRLVRIGTSWAVGEHAVKIVYSGGYSNQAAVPESLKQIAVELTGYFWHQAKLGDGRLGLSGKAGGGGGVTGFVQEIPQDLQRRLAQWRTARSWFG